MTTWVHTPVKGNENKMKEMLGVLFLTKLCFLPPHFFLGVIYCLTSHLFLFFQSMDRNKWLVACGGCWKEFYGGEDVSKHNIIRLSCPQGPFVKLLLIFVYVGYHCFLKGNLDSSIMYLPSWQIDILLVFSPCMLNR